MNHKYRLLCLMFSLGSAAMLRLPRQAISTMRRGLRSVDG
jgi:hypothetical protein